MGSLCPFDWGLSEFDDHQRSGLRKAALAPDHGIADLAATGAGLSTDGALDAIALSFRRWLDDGAADIGIQTRAVLSATRRRLSGRGAGAGAIMRKVTNAHLEQPQSAGNGALMRTAPVALAHHDDLADVARRVAGLTHAESPRRDSCV